MLGHVKFNVLISENNLRTLVRYVNLKSSVSFCPSLFDDKDENNNISNEKDKNENHIQKESRIRKAI